MWSYGFGCLPSFVACIESSRVDGDGHSVDYAIEFGKDLTLASCQVRLACALHLRMRASSTKSGG